MSKIVIICGLILCCLFAMANSDDIDCAKIPIENLEPCKNFLTKNGSSTRPSGQCCDGVNSWIGAPPEIVCQCYKRSPNRLSFKPNEIRAAALPYECKAAEFYGYISCLLPED